MKIRRIDFSPDEWIAGCVMLTNAERGLYITACALIYSNGGPIELDHLRDACTDHGHSFKAQIRRLLALGKLTSNGSQISNKRSLNELQNAFKRASNARQNGAKGGRPNGLENPVVFPSRARNHQPSTINDSSPRGELKSKPNGLETRAKAPPKRKAPFPPDWQPDEQDAQFARKRGRDDAWIAREGERCRDNHNAKGNVFADRHAAWRTWVMNAPTFERVNGSTPARPARTEAEQWAWHAENYATRRIMLNADERTSPMDPEGRWFNPDLVAAAEAKMRSKRA